MADQWDDYLDALDKNPAQADSAPAANGAPAPDWDAYLDSLEKPAAALEKGKLKYAPQKFGPGRLPEMVAVAGLGAINTILGFPGDVTNLAARGANSLFSSNPLALSPDTPPPFIAPGSSIFSNALGPGLEGHPELTPQGPLEKTVAAVGGAIPSMMAMGRSGLKANPIATMGVPLAAAAGAEGLQDLFPDNRVAPIVGGLVGALGGASAAGALERRLLKSAAAREFANAQVGLDRAAASAAALTNPDTGPKNDLAIARQTARLDAKKAQDTAVALNAQSRARLVGVEKTAAEAEGLAEQDLVVSHEGVANKLGESTTIQQAGEAAQPIARNWVEKEFPKKLAAVSDPLDAAVDGGTPTPIFGFAKTLNSLRGNAGKLQGIVDDLLPKLPQKLQTTLKEALDSPAGNNPVAAKPQFSTALIDADGKPLQTGTIPGKTGTPVTWEEARALRSTIGNALSNPKLVNDVGENELKALYASVTGDLRSAAKDKGAVDLFDHFNEESTKLYNLKSNLTSRIVSTTNPGQERLIPEEVVDGLLSAGGKGGTVLGQLRAEMPKAADELAATALRTGRWKDLSIEAKEALVPDAGQRAQVGRAAVARANTAAAAKRQLAQAKSDEQAVRDAIAQDTRDGRFTRTQAVVSAQRAKATAEFQAAEAERQAKGRMDAAKAALPPEPTQNELNLATVAHVGKALVGAGGAGSLGYGVFHDPQTAAMAAIVGMAAPHIARAIKSVGARPANALVPMVGTVAGENALAPGQPEGR